MLHLKDIVNYEKNIYKIKSMNTIEDIFALIRSKKGFIKEIIEDKYYNEALKKKYVFSDGSISGKCILELIENSDINEYIIESSEFIGTFINSEDLNISKDSDYLFLYDNHMSIMIPIKKVKTEAEEYYKIYIEKLTYVKEFLIGKCDGCSCKSLKELLFNLYPEINTGLSKKYSDFRGSVCCECLSTMEKGMTLKNEECESAYINSHVDEKIDEFSSIEEILKFCGMENKEELEEIIKNKINI